MGAGMFGYRPAYQTPLAQLYFNAPAPTSISAVKPTLSEKISGAISNGLQKVGLGTRQATRLGGKIGGALEALTPVGSATAADQAKRDYLGGNFMGAAANGLGAALGLLPDGGAGLAHAIIAPLYHGSPHAFEKFALEKIGTGEGAQAYGHGLYFAENPAVAKGYRSDLANANQFHAPMTLDGQEITNAAGHPNTWVKAENRYLTQGDNVGAWQAQMMGEAIRNNIGSIRTLKAHLNKNPLPGAWRDQATYNQALKDLGNRATIGTKGGHLYEVSLNAEPDQLLNWDAPFSAQSSPVQTAIAPRLDQLGQMGDVPVPTDPQGSWLYKAMSPALDLGANGPEANASERLLKAGVPGLNYLDRFSRGAGAGSRNYVVFDPSIIDILNRR